MISDHEELWCRYYRSAGSYTLRAESDGAVTHLHAEVVSYKSLQEVEMTRTSLVLTFVSVLHRQTSDSYC